MESTGGAREIFQREGGGGKNMTLYMFGGRGVSLELSNAKGSSKKVLF